MKKDAIAKRSPDWLERTWVKACEEIREVKAQKQRVRDAMWQAQYRSPEPVPEESQS